MRQRELPARTCRAFRLLLPTVSWSRWLPTFDPTSVPIRQGRVSRTPCGRQGAGTVIELRVNGQSHRVRADPDTPLLYVLRDELQLNAAKFGCGLGHCGSCTVLIDGAPTLSCVT